MGWRELPHDHPVWKIAVIVTQACAVTFVFGVCAYITANSFDANEIQMLAGGGVVVGIGSAVKQFIKS